MQEQKKGALERFAMNTSQKYKSDAFEAIHRAVEGMYHAGTVDKGTMQTFDESCLTEPTKSKPNGVLRRSKPSTVKYLRLP